MSTMLVQGDARRLPLADASVDSVVTDPPAGIGFMGKEWDDFRRSRNPADAGRDDVFGRTSAKAPEYGRRERDGFVRYLAEALAEAYRVAKPGSRMLCWAIPRTSHWTGTAIENAGWIIEDRIAHLFGQGFPKAKSRLKPACEDWWLARKAARTVPPLPGLDGCRIASGEAWAGDNEKYSGANGYGPGDSDGWKGNWHKRAESHTSGRWPANVTLDEEAAAELDEMSGHMSASYRNGDRALRTNHNQVLGKFPNREDGWSQTGAGYSDSGGASRFFYCPKSSRSDRGEGNTHPTVKSTELMRWLCRLITPPGGTVLDMFNGSGSTGVAAVEEGFNYIGIEREAEYLAIARARLAHATRQPLLFGSVA